METQKKHNMCFLPVSGRNFLKETQKISVEKIQETHHVFPWEKPFGDHMTCLYKWIFPRETAPGASSDFIL